MRKWMELPTGRKLEAPDRPENYYGSIDVLQKATPDRVAVARRHWTEAKRDDFTVDGRNWRDRASGEHYRIAKYDPLIGLDPKTNNISAFLVSDGMIVFLYRVGAEDKSVQRVVLGEVGAREVAGHEPLGMAASQGIY
jgi:hypothetical protein